jgi:RNA polymerase sigma-70 factor, ECF subfamily
MDSHLTDLFERYHRSVFWYCLRHTRCREDAEDLTQEVFYRVSRSVGRYKRRGVGQETVWLFRIARNIVIDHRRRQPAPIAGIPAARIGRDGTQLVAFGLKEALGLVAEQDREVFVLREVVGLSYVEIGAICDMTEDGVRARLYRVRGQLRGLLGSRARTLNAQEGDRRR